MVFDNGFNNENFREFLNKEWIEYHLPKPNSHTRISDVERLNNTITEKIRTLNLENHLPICQQIYKAFMLYSYNDTPLEVQNNKINHEGLCEIKEVNIHKVNRNRENYVEIR